MNTKAKGFLVILAILSAATLHIAFKYDQNTLNISLFIFWCILAVIAESLGVEMPNGAQISVSLAVCMAVIICEGVFSACIASAASYVFRVLKTEDGKVQHVFNTPFYKTFFNVCQGVISTGFSGLAYLYAGGKIGNFSILPSIVIVAVYIIFNTSLLSAMISILSAQNIITVIKYNFAGLVPSSLAVGSIGIIIAIANISRGQFGVVLFFGPLLLARYSFKLYVDMRNTYIETIEAFTKSMEAKDPYTSGHASRVKEYAVRLAKAMKLSPRQIDNVEKAAILHDIGKIGIDDCILRKNAVLSKEEYDEIKKHPSIGADIIKSVSFLKEVSEIVRCHHERYDGTGYPRGLSKDDIPLESYILAVADVYDAMTSKRPYRNSLDEQTALEQIRLGAGTQFHPEVAKAFLDIMGYTEKRYKYQSV